VFYEKGLPRYPIIFTNHFFAETSLVLALVSQKPFKEAEPPY